MSISGMNIPGKFQNSLTARLLLVLFAFLLMIVSGCVVMYTTLNTKLLQDAETTMDDTQILFSRILMEPEIMLDLVANNIEGIHNRGDGFDAIKGYIREAASDEYKERLRVEYYTVYAYFEAQDEFFDGVGWIPGDDYKPKTRPWYETAQAAAGDIGITSPYIDANTGDLVITYARLVHDARGHAFGVVCVDVFIDSLRDMVVNKRITPNSYGFMIDDNAHVVMHPEPAIENTPYGDHNPEIMKSYGKDIQEGKDISLQSVPNYEGMPSIIFGRQLDNNWYFILLVPASEYYSELFHMIIITTALGAVFATALILMLVSIERAKRKADEEHREKVMQLAEAEGATQAKSSFLAQMSHEIRTPMNAILGITEIQLQDESLPPGTREALSKIYNSGDMLMGIINDILDLSKIEAGKLELLAEEYEFASMFVDTVQLNQMRIGSKQIVFSLNVSEDMPVMLYGDELRIKQILNNILSNAFKYTSKGEVNLSVYVEPLIVSDDARAIPYNGEDLIPESGSGGNHINAHSSEELKQESGSNDDARAIPQIFNPDAQTDIEDKVLLIIKVTDTGQGMTAEQVAKLGERYSRFNEKANRTTEGTGLGMNITRNLVHLMNGDIAIESAPGKGSTFTISIPQGRKGTAVLGKDGAQQLCSNRISSAARMKRAQITREPMPYGSVLIVDDVETNIYVASGLLAPYGIKMESAESGYEAIEKVKNGKVYDIIFMDHMMPNMDGIEATQKIRDMGYIEPIIALTANAVAGQAEMFLSKGFNDFISKPIDIRQMNAALNKWVRDKQPPEVIEEARRKAGGKAAAGTGPAVSHKLLQAFLRDAGKSVAVLEEILVKKDAYSEDDINMYTVVVHGLKGTLAIIGMHELSDVARRLETVGREGNTKVITAETPPFLISLKALMEDIALKEYGESGDGKPDPAEDEDPAFVREKLSVIKAACADLDNRTADEAINALREKKLSAPTRKLLDAVTEYLLHSDFDEAAGAIDKFMGTLPT